MIFTNKLTTNLTDFQLTQIEDERSRFIVTDVGLFLRLLGDRL
jgi:hypothetical protein